MDELQACAAIGQPRLMRLYDEAFGRHGMRVAQVLVTYLDMDSRALYGNIQRTVERLLKTPGIVPIFNENDVVSYEELVGARFGDNDQLSAHIAVLARASRLIILSNIRGLATKSDGTGRLIKDVNGVDAKIEKLAGGTRSQTSVGGMVSKLKAARLVNAAGIPMQIAHGRQKGVLLSICQGEDVGTMFHADKGKS
jgi:glutamate 5-kinase